MGRNPGCVQVEPLTQDLRSLFLKKSISSRLFVSIRVIRGPQKKTYPISLPMGWTARFEGLYKFQQSAYVVVVGLPTVGLSG